MREGWEYKKLGEVASFSRGLTFSKNDVATNTSKKVLRSNNIDLATHSLNFDDVACLKEDFDIPTDKMLHKNDIFICMSNGSTQHLGKVAFIESELDYAFGGFMGAIHPNANEVYPKFLFLSCLSSEYRSFLASILNGININNLKWSELSRFTIPLPPLSEQERIVSELDLLTSIIEKKKAQLKELDNLAQSIFYDLFGDPITNEKGWEVKKLEDVVSDNCSISYGIVQPGDDVEDGIPVVRPVDLVNRIVKRKGLKVVEKTISDSYKRTILKGNEILFCVRGTTGVMSFASPELKGCNVTRGITPLSFNDMLVIQYVYYLLNSSYLQSIITAKTRGIALKQINMKDVRELPIIIPPLSLQQSFAEKVEAIEHQKELIQQSIAETETLFNSRMDYYFN